ncbi:hypothetical protein AB0M22_28115 [Nocardia sp. NPDC051756]|uniref:hypothetical protein n=1 Tax=Nocardia sp. NPDC051756 TaxID=3154751 RepID=UPI0034159632
MQAPAVAEFLGVGEQRQDLIEVGDAFAEYAQEFVVEVAAVVLPGGYAARDGRVE